MHTIARRTPPHPPAGVDDDVGLLVALPEEQRVERELEVRVGDVADAKVLMVEWVWCQRCGQLVGWRLR